MSTAPADVALPALDWLDWPALEVRLDQSGFAMTPPLTSTATSRSRCSC